jgi:hypothetical protein
MDADQLKSTLEKLAAKPHEPTTQKDEGGLSNPQVLFSWEAPLRAYKRTSTGVLRFYATIAVLLSLLAVFFNEPILVIPIWAVMFLVYVLTITPPHNVRHNITKFGVQTGGRTLHWDELSHFYFIQKFDYYILVLFTKNPYENPSHLVIPDKATHQKVLQELSHRIIYEEHPEKTLTDKFAEWLTTLMPEEENRAVVSKPEEKSL